MIREAYAKYIAAEIDNRDNTVLHVSDLADCSRAVWAKRNGKALEPFNDDTIRKFHMGLDIEERVGKSLAMLENFEVERQYVHRLGATIGHSDFLARCKTDPNRSFVLEIKSTTFYPKLVNGKRTRVAPKESEVQWHYRLQAAAYAMSVDFSRFCIFIVCRESGMVAECWYKTEDYRDAVTTALEEKVALTGIGDPMPPAEPPIETYNAKGVSWRCNYCSFSACEKNENPAALEVAA